MKKAYAYIRVSTKKQVVEGISLDAQKMKLRDWAKAHDYEIVQYFVDKGRTGTNTNRPELKRMLELAEHSKPDTIVCYQSDRLTRNMFDHTRIRKQLKEWGIGLTYTNLEIDITTPHGKLIDNVMSSVNEFQSDIIKLKTYDSMLSKARSGWPPKEAPFGYKNVKNKNPKGTLDKKIIVIDPTTGPIVVECFELYATGNYSYKDIAKFLNSKKVKPKRSDKFCVRFVEHMMKSKFYIGTFRWADEWHDGKYEPLISKTLFKQVQRTIAKRNHYACRKRKYKFLLRGFLYYKDTGGLAYAEYPTKYKGKIGYYFDSEQAKGTYVKTELLEKSMEKFMRKIQLSKEYKEKIMNMVEKVLEDRRGRIDSEKRRLTVRKSELEHALREIEDERFIAKSVSKEKFSELYDRYNQDLKDVETELAKLNVDYQKRIKELEKILDMAQNIGEAYKNASFYEKRTYLNIFIKKAWVKNKRLCHIELNDNIKQLIVGGRVCVNTSWGG